jgi:hypothetical protein
VTEDSLQNDDAPEARLLFVLRIEGQFGVLEFRGPPEPPL